MTAEFTPGPWTTNVKRLSDNSICVAHVVGERDRVSLAQLANHGEEQTVANARLMSAAPDLLEALEALLSAMTQPTCYDWEDVSGTLIGQAQNALAKARGAF